MKPTKGRIVLYVLPKVSTRPTCETRAAIVTRVATEEGWSYPPEHEVVNLRVFLDGDSDLVFAGVTERMTSVKHDEDKVPGTWHWPPRP